MNVGSITDDTEQRAMYNERKRAREECTAEVQEVPEEPLPNWSLSWPEEEAVRRFTTVRVMPQGMLQRNIARVKYHMKNRVLYPGDAEWHKVVCTRLVFAHK